MKNAMLISALVLILTACDSSSDTIATTGTAGTANTTPATTTTTTGSARASISTAGCSIVANVSGGLITCADGSSAHITNGTNGTQGPQGATGAAGAAGTSAPSYHLTDGNSHQVGTGLLSSNAGTVTVISSEAYTYSATYNLGGGTITQQLLAYENSYCQGNPYLSVTTGPTYTVFGVPTSSTTVALYSSTSTTVTFAPKSMSNGSGGCTSYTDSQTLQSTLPSGMYMQAMSYTGTNLPVTLAMPTSISIH